MDGVLGPEIPPSIRLCSLARADAGAAPTLGAGTCRNSSAGRRDHDRRANKADDRLLPGGRVDCVHAQRPAGRVNYLVGEAARKAGRARSGHRIASGAILPRRDVDSGESRVGEVSHHLQLDAIAPAGVLQPVNRLDREWRTRCPRPPAAHVGQLLYA